MKRLVCFHLFNDFSGSPKVLRMVLGGLLERGEWSVEIVTSKGEGALSDLEGWKGVRMHRYAYRFSENGVVTMLTVQLGAGVPVLDGLSLSVQP